MFLRARFYSAGDGRFVSRDTWGGDSQQPLSLNGWVYVESNPINRTDPSGTQPLGSTKNDSGGDQYYRYDQTLSYIYNEMMKNSQGENAKIMRKLLQQGTVCNDYFVSTSLGEKVGAHLGAYMLFFNLVRAGGEWDHKPKIMNMLNLRDDWNDLYFPIRDGTKYEYYYDIWSNIHYGFVGSSIGFEGNTLQFFANVDKYIPKEQEQLKQLMNKYFGSYDPGDEISVNIGLTLWKNHQYSLTKTDLQNEIVKNRVFYFISQDRNFDGKLNGSEIDPNVGKLLPPDTVWSDRK